MKRRRRFVVAVVALVLAQLAALVLAGCSAAPLPTTHYYTLRPEGEIAVADRSPGADGLVVGIEPLLVDPPYDQDRLVYRLAPDATEVGFYSYHRWAAPLGELVALAIAHGLRDTAGIAVVEPAVSGNDYTAGLGGRLFHLEHVDSAQGQEVRIGLELVLRGADRDVLWSESLTDSSAIEAESVEQVVAALCRTLERLVKRSRGGIESALSAATP